MGFAVHAAVFSKYLADKAHAYPPVNPGLSTLSATADLANPFRPPTFSAPHSQQHPLLPNQNQMLESCLPET